MRDTITDYSIAYNVEKIRHFCKVHNAKVYNIQGRIIPFSKCKDHHFLIIKKYNPDVISIACLEDYAILIYYNSITDICYLCYYGKDATTYTTIRSEFQDSSTGPVMLSNNVRYRVSVLAQEDLDKFNREPNFNGLLNTFRDASVGVLVK